MLRDLAKLVVTRADFEVLRALCRSDFQFPPTWEDWVALSDRAAREASRAGVEPMALLLDPREFKSWCSTQRVMAGVEALRAYAIVCRHRIIASPREDDE